LCISPTMFSVVGSLPSCRRPLAPVSVHCCGAPRALRSFPTRRSSDLGRGTNYDVSPANRSDHYDVSLGFAYDVNSAVNNSARGSDRKSTRLNSSHVKISYAVFCLKKKKKDKYRKHIR